MVPADLECRLMRVAATRFGQLKLCDMLLVWVVVVVVVVLHCVAVVIWQGFLDIPQL